MQNIIHKIFLKEFDAEVHGALVKYSKGEFNNKYLIDVKRRKDGWIIKTGSEFSNYFVLACLEKTSGEIEVSGAIVATFDVQSKAQFPIERIKQFMGVKQAVVNTKTSPDKIIDLMKTFPRAFYALSFSTPSYQLKIKAKAPKSPKPAATGEKEIKVDFCSLKTSDESIIKDLLFDINEFNDIFVKHAIQINEIILPKGIEDPIQIREQAIKKGKIIRIAVVDGKERKSEAGFEA